jgi:hypothetical protein
VPIYWRELHPPPIHFFPQPVRVLLHRLSNETMSPARSHIGFDLLPDVFIKNGQAFVFRLYKIH